MGVGTPVNILEAVARGIDLFDCVPRRNARHGHIFTWRATRASKPKNTSGTAPRLTRMRLPHLQSFSRAYIRHLFKSGEMLAMRFA